MSGKPEAALPPAHLRIVGINDVYTLDHLPRLATLVEQARSVEPADVLLITVAGDFLAPSLLSSLDGGRGMVDCLDALGVTHVTLGNHEDDLTFPDLVSRLDELDATVLLTNVDGFRGRSQSSDVVAVGPHAVGLVGVVNGDPALYHRAPFGGATVHHTLPALRSAVQRLRGEGCAAIVALTHQPLPDDRVLADEGLVDLILGGHEHGGHTERDHAAPLIKAPMDAVAAAIADLHIRGPSQVQVTVRLQPVASFNPDPAMAARVAGHLAAVRDLEAQVLLELGPGQCVSSRGAREAQTTLGALVCSRLRDTLDADAALFNSGALRGGTEHHERLTFADFQRELPLQSEAVVVELPGAVLADVIHFSRTARTGTGGFLQLDDGIQTDDQQRPTHVAAAPFEANRTYRVAMPRGLLMGIDRIEPLVAWATQHPDHVPPATTGIDVKVALLRAFAGA